MAKYYLHQQIGTVCNVIEPDAYTSAVTIAATDNTTGVPVNGADNIMFIINMGDIGGTGGLTNLGFYYDSAGVASNATLVDTDSLFSFLGSDEENSVFLADLDLGGKGLTDDAGVVYVVNDTDAMPGAGDFGVIGIPYNMKRLPSTNENTVQFIGETST